MTRKEATKLAINAGRSHGNTVSYDRDVAKLLGSFKRI